MKNTPFNNPFKCKFKKKQDDNSILVSKRMDLELDDAVVVKNLAKQNISVDDLKQNDLLRIRVSETEPFKIVAIEVMPPNPTDQTNKPHPTK